MNREASVDPAVRLWTHDLAGWQTPPATWLDALDDDERARCRRFARERDGLAYAAAHALLRRALGRTLGLAPQSLRIDRDTMGKPFLATPENSGLDFSMSHTDGMVAVTVSSTGKVGVDVEAVDRPAPELSDLSAFGLSAEEIAQLAALDEPERAGRFFARWTACEAVAKADGRGLALPFEHIAIDLSRNQAEISPEVSSPRRHWRLWREQPSPRHLLALAWPQDGGRLLRMGHLL